MVPLASLLVASFFLGLQHATEPDHLVAVTTIVSRERTIRAAAPVGAIWGVGHTATILVLGGAIVLFGIVIPARVGLLLELAVGAMLILLGAVNVVRAPRRDPAHRPHPDDPHRHAHTHAAVRGRSPTSGPGLLRPLMVGVVHGLAGSAAIALLVLSTIHAPAWAVAYLAVFGLGTVVGMLLITVAMAMPLAYAAHHFEQLHRGLCLVAGVLSVGFGAMVICQIGVVDGLFTTHPHWTPR
jgi:high-affinity nickel-transport protein